MFYSPVKKRIKESSKDQLQHQQYELYRQNTLQQHSPLDSYGRPSHITIHDTPPLAHSRQGTQPRKGVPEVITISDSDDESPPKEASKVEAAIKTSDKVGTSTSTTSTTTVASSKTIKAPMASTNNSSGCPSVMALTPGKPGDHELTSTQSTPCASRSHATSCVTVGDSDEDASPIKPEPGLTASTTITKKTRLLKAQSEWMLSSLKEEDSPAGSLAATAAPSRSGGPYGSRLSVVDEKELMQRYSTSSTLRQDYLSEQLLYRDRDIESRAIESRAREMVERERDREREFALQLAQPPPIAHPAEYSTNSRQMAAAIAASRPTVEYIQPPVAHSQAAAVAAAAQQQDDVLNVQRAAAAQLAAAAAHYRQSSPRGGTADFYAAAAAAAGAAPATVYVTTTGYGQQIAIPPPTQPPPAHHSRAVLAPPPAHPLPAHMQPAAAAAAAAALFPGHPQVAASYGYAPLSPGKTRYLY